MKGCKTVKKQASAGDAARRAEAFQPSPQQASKSQPCLEPFLSNHLLPTRLPELEGAPSTASGGVLTMSSGPGLATGDGTGPRW